MRIGETMEVSVVNVDVFVTDKHGQRIRGLTKDDFEIYENGVKQNITNFSEYADGKPMQSTDGDATSQKRTVVLFIDRIHLSKPDSDAFFNSIKELFHKTIRPGDGAMIASFAVNRVQVDQPFTDDAALLDRALDAIAPRVTGPYVDEYQQAKEDADEMRHFEMQTAANNFETLPPAINQVDGAVQSWSAEMYARGMSKKAQADQERKLDALKVFLRAVAGVDGKKLMLLATHRLSRLPGAEFIYASGTSPIGIGEHRSEFDATEDVRSLYETANADGVAIYTMYPEGFREPVQTAMMGSDGRTEIPTGEATGAAQFSAQQVGFAIKHNEMSALMEIADFTGGRAASGAESSQLLVDVKEDLDSYYSLGYHAAPGSTESARTIAVKTKRADLIIRSRREYVAKSDIRRMEDRVLSALYRDPPPAPFKIAVSLQPPRKVKNGVMIPVTVRIPIGALTALPDGRDYSGEFSVYFATGAKSRGASEPTHISRPFRIPARDLEKARQSYYSYQCSILGDAATDRIVFGVIDEVSKEYAVSTVTFKLQLARN